MTSNTAKGNRYKKKTKEWFEKRGYYTVYVETVYSIFTPRGIIYKKRDILGSDGISMKDQEFIFWNSKVTDQGQKGITDMTKKGEDEFSKYPFPDFIKRQLIIWEPRAKNPLIINCI